MLYFILGFFVGFFSCTAIVFYIGLKKIRSDKQKVKNDAVSMADFILKRTFKNAEEILKKEAEKLKEENKRVNKKFQEQILNNKLDTDEKLADLRKETFEKLVSEGMTESEAKKFIDENLK